MGRELFTWPKTLKAVWWLWLLLWLIIIIIIIIYFFENSVENMVEPDGEQMTL